MNQPDPFLPAQGTLDIALCPVEESHTILNLYPFYLYDLSEIWERQPNRHGVFEEEDSYRTLAEQSEVFWIWWQHPGILFPYVIRVDGIPAGFALVSTPPYIPSYEKTDYFMHEFFVMRPFRGQGLAAQAARQIFGQFRGSWELHTNPTERNVHARRFWEQLLMDYTHNEYTRQLIDGPDNEQFLSFRFDNRKI
ncbi:GNAT family N-acetyltransferase [Paenibacillus shenyangensis]|uniref:GNAT family N-acetyltransferase n=1 Tax=Paenibacillus sp. A9 TaxID=1284352 RepID=UPI000370A731|nr:GNAT family N-acetyltransferase [Paenibacillus sp. A9]